MSEQYQTRTVSVLVVPVGQPTYSEMATEIRIEDEAAGEFVEVKQVGRTDVGKVCIAPEEWPALREAIDRMISECREVKK